MLSLLPISTKEVVYIKKNIEKFNYWLKESLTNSNSRNTHIHTVWNLFLLPIFWILDFWYKIGKMVFSCKFTYYSYTDIDFWQISVITLSATLLLLQVWVTYDHILLLISHKKLEVQLKNPLVQLKQLVSYIESVLEGTKNYNMLGDGLYIKVFTFRIWEVFK